MAAIPLACGSNKAASGETDGNVPDTLHAATLYGPTSYFSYRGQTMGFDYENVKRFAEDENLVLDLKVAPSLNALLKMLENGEIELAAYPIPIIEEYNKVVRHCGYKGNHMASACAAPQQGEDIRRNRSCGEGRICGKRLKVLLQTEKS